MKSAHNVKAYRNNTDTADKAAFLGSYLTKETVNIEKLCEQIAAQSGLTAIQMRAILEGSFDSIAELEKEGLVIVHLDGLAVMAVIVKPVFLQGFSELFNFLFTCKIHFL